MADDNAVIEYRDEDIGLVFRWHGGAYIDVGHYGEWGSPGVDGDDFHAYDVINVWNDELEESTFESAVEIRKMAGASIRRPFRWILEGFEERCREYLAESARD
jgi:hypothetical protein